MPELPEVETMCRVHRGGGRLPHSRRRASQIAAAIDLDLAAAGPVPPPGRGKNDRRHPSRGKAGRVGVGGKRLASSASYDFQESLHRCPTPPHCKGGTGRLHRLGTAHDRLVLLEDPPDRKHRGWFFNSAPCGKPPPTSTPARQILFWDQRGLGVARLLSPEQFREAYGPDRLGPDALTISAQTLRQRLGGSRRAIKVALLDQHAVAGIGNLYASEILHHAGIHPAIPCCRLRSAQWLKLHAAIGRRVAGGHSPSRLDAPRRHLSHRPQQARRLPDFSPRLPTSGGGVPALRPWSNREDRPGPAVDLLLPRLPAVLWFRPERVNWLPCMQIGVPVTV